MKNISQFKIWKSKWDIQKKKLKEKTDELEKKDYPYNEELKKELEKIANQYNEELEKKIINIIKN